MEVPVQAAAIASRSRLILEQAVQVAATRRGASGYARKTRNATKASARSAGGWWSPRRSDKLKGVSLGKIGSFSVPAAESLTPERGRGGFPTLWWGTRGANATLAASS